MTDLNFYLNLKEELNKAEAKTLCDILDLSKKVEDGIDAFYKKNGKHRLTQINVLDYNHLQETQTSDLILRLLRYELDGGYPVWKSFVTNFFSKELAEQINSPIFQSEKEHIDISVKENGKYAFIFENKLKNAPFQRNQLGRYIMTLLRSSFKLKDIYIIILPGYMDDDFFSQIRPSVWKAPYDWGKPNDERKCIDSESEDNHACLCDSGQIVDNEWCSKKCNDFKKQYKSIKDNIRVIDYEFTDWLLKVADEIIPTWEIYMKSATVQFAHYIKGLYNIRLNTLEVMENIEILQKELNFGQDWDENSKKVEKAITDLSNLEQSLKYLAIICKLRNWQSQVEKDHSDLDIDGDNEGFWFRVDGVQCGVWFDNEKKKYYWGFYDDQKAIVSKQAEFIINDIIAKVGLEDVEHSCGYIAWKYTENGATVMNDFITAAKGIKECVLSKKQ